MIWVLEAAAVLLILVVLLEGVRDAGQLPKAGLWLPLLLLGGLGFFVSYVGWHISPDCRPAPPLLDDRFDGLDGADQLARLTRLRTEVSDRLARCQNAGDEAQRWTLYLRLGEMIETLEAEQTQRELEQLSPPS